MCGVWGVTQSRLVPLHLFLEDFEQQLLELVAVADRRVELAHDRAVLLEQTLDLHLRKEWRGAVSRGRERGATPSVRAARSLDLLLRQTLLALAHLRDDLGLLGMLLLQLGGERDVVHLELLEQSQLLREGMVEEVRWRRWWWRWWRW